MSPHVSIACYLAIFAALATSLVLTLVITLKLYPLPFDIALPTCVGGSCTTYNLALTLCLTFSTWVGLVGCCVMFSWRV